MSPEDLFVFSGLSNLGGAATLKVYAARVAASDRKAAEILGSRMPKREYSAVTAAIAAAHAIAPGRRHS